MDVSIRDSNVPGATTPKFFEGLKSLGLSGIEIYVLPDLTTSQIRKDDDTPYSIKDASGVRELKDRLSREGVKVWALLVDTDFCAPNVDDHVAYAVAAARAARELGAPAVRIDTHPRNTTRSPEDNIGVYAKGVKRALDQTADTGVDFGMENHGPVSNNPAWLDGVFAQVPDRRLGMTLDTGNFYWFGHPLAEMYRILEHFAPRAKHTHIKNINYPKDIAEQKREVGYEYGKYCSPLDEGNIDVRRVVAILKKAGYDRSLCIENESLGKYKEDERPQILKRDAKILRDGINAR